ncbi:MAG: hypothetical protein ACTTKL_11425 [Treponema sp.]
MNKNMDLGIGFKGSAKINAQAIPMQEGYLKLGGIAAGGGERCLNDIEEFRPHQFLHRQKLAENEV